MWKDGSSFRPKFILRPNSSATMTFLSPKPIRSDRSASRLYLNLVACWTKEAGRRRRRRRLSKLAASKRRFKFGWVIAYIYIYLRKSEVRSTKMSSKCYFLSKYNGSAKVAETRAVAKVGRDMSSSLQSLDETCFLNLRSKMAGAWQENGKKTAYLRGLLTLEPYACLTW